MLTYLLLVKVLELTPLLLVVVVVAAATTAAAAIAKYPPVVFVQSCTGLAISQIARITSLSPAYTLGGVQ